MTGEESSSSVKGKMLKASLAPVMGLLRSMMKDIQPENNVSQWVFENLPIIMGDDAGGEDEELGLEVLTSMFVMKTNVNPRETLQRLILFHNSFGTFYKENLKEKNPDKKDDLLE